MLARQAPQSLSYIPTPSGGRSLNGKSHEFFIGSTAFINSVDILVLYHDHWALVPVVHSPIVDGRLPLIEGSRTLTAPSLACMSI